MAQRSWSSLILFAALGLLVVAVLFAYVVGLTSPAAGFFHDDGIYLVTARALGEGRGYRIISLPAEIAQTKYPILFPLLLSFAWRVHPAFPDNLLLLKTVPFLAGAAWLLLVYRFMRREGESRLMAAVVAGLAAATPLAVFSVTSLLSETLFAALLWGALWRLREIETRNRASLSEAVLVGSLCAAAVHARVMGLVLLPAGLWLLWRRDHRCGAAFGLTMVVLILPWFLWVGLQDLPALSYLDYYTSSNYESWNVITGFEWGKKAQIVGWNLLYLVVAPAQLLLVRGMPWPLLLGIGLFAYWGVVRSAFKEKTAISLFLLAYLALLVLWAWRPLRFLVPVYPLLLWFLILELRRLFRVSRAGAVARRHGLSLLLALLIVNSASAILRWGREARASGVPCPVQACPASWAEARAAFEWLRANASEEAVLMGNLDPVLYLYTGRKAVRAFAADPYLLSYSLEPGRRPLGTGETLRRRARASGASYFVWAPLSSFAETPFLEEAVAEAVREHPGLFVRVEEASGSWITVYRIEQLRWRFPPRGR